MEVIKQKISEQMEFTSQSNYESEVGTFFWKTTKKYDYPDDLELQVGEQKYPLDEADKIATARKVVVKDYEANNDPISETKSLQFRGKKK